jgi:hypothetical protein
LDSYRTGYMHAGVQSQAINRKGTDMALINSEAKGKELDAKPGRQPFRKAIARSFTTLPKARKRRKGTNRLAIYGLVVIAPTLIVSGYFAFVAAPIYVSEASFVVRMAAPPSPARRTTPSRCRSISARGRL